MTPIQYTEDLLAFIDASPSPWHAAANIEQRLIGAGFQRLQESAAWQLTSGGRYYAVRDDSSIVLFAIGSKPLADSGFKIVGAHTDSPGLRVKPSPQLTGDRLLRLSVEVYGGPILATFSDRDLSLAGRIAYRHDGGIASKLVHFEQALLRLPNLAIHMNRGVNEDGLKFHKQNELPLLLAGIGEQPITDQHLPTMLARQAGIEAEQILAWELNVYDTQKGAIWGENREFYADSQLDNLASCHAGLTALLEACQANSEQTLVCAFFDHEEIGSESCKGAAGSFLSDMLERIAATQEPGGENYRRALANSSMISADMAHAYHPNFPNAYEANHKIVVNGGPVIKINANHRYATHCLSEAMFADLCRQVDVPVQKYSHRGDLPCGSTIGPISSAKLGIATVDVGSPMWAMHSARESAGVLDHEYMIRVLRRFLGGN